MLETKWLQGYVSIDFDAVDAAGDNVNLMFGGPKMLEHWLIAIEKWAR